ncbi:hypothetical protein F5984_16150 [Rudanella paleaurantiibacter]|uniref:O-antigen ligase domain-containing protein n=1 Tax=Rudanella paleaurantiibacter TaxID=2614655 RepID=A0A7J5TX13_9BACT|nr:hypothetical protein [Rudanella paleaurantiibacter]KAB7729174.1 hypothetical protein F5984_16150 [Rudanella paleaurantiibacter]
MPIRRLLSLFAWAIVGCGASRWRLMGVGPGEVLLGIASVIALLSMPEQSSTTPMSRVWRWFVCLSLLCLFTGTLWALALGVWLPGSFWHDAIALLFCFGSLCCLMPHLTDPDGQRYLVRQLLRAGVAFAFANGLVYILFGWVLGETSPWIGRLNGVSSNPNQVALYVCALPFWLMHAASAHSRLFSCIGLAACLAVGWLSGSEALRLAWAVGFGLAGFWSVRAWAQRRPAYERPYLLALITLVGLWLIGGVLAFCWTYAADIYAIGGQGDLRLLRWQHGLTAVSYSPLFGLGPGAFSGNGGAFEGQEAHNLYIDWMASGGVLAGLLLLAFQYHVARGLIRSGHYVLLAGLVALLIFGGFHYVARHPVFWLSQLLMLGYATLLKSSSSTNQRTLCAVSSVR